MERMGEGGIDRYLLLLATTVSSFFNPFTTQMLNLALVDIGSEFSVGSHSLGLVSTVFLLISVMAMVPIAKLSDIRSPRSVFLVGLILFTISFVGCAFAPTFYILLFFRAVAGVSSAAIAVPAVIMLVNLFPAERRGWAIGINTTVIYLGLALGPSLGGFATDLIGWRALFMVLVPIALVALYATMKFGKPVASDRKGRFDTLGAILFMVSILILMYGVINLPEMFAMICIVIGMALMGVFVYYVRHVDDPILDVSVYKNKVFRRSLLAAFLNYGSSYSVSFFLALYLQNIGSLSASEAGLILLLQPAVQFLLTAKAGSMADKVSDDRILPTAGMALISVAVFMVLFIGTEVNLILIAAILLILGLGFALFSAPNMSVIMSSVPPKERGIASGSVSLARQVGMMVSMGVAMCCISVFLGTTDDINPSTYEAFVDTMRAAFSVCLIMCLIGTVLSWSRSVKTTD